MIYAINFVLDYVLHFCPRNAERKDLFFRALERYLSNRVPEDTFIVSFSEASDLLSQWRAYAPDRGISVGISLSNLSNFCSKNGLRVEKVIYDPSEQKLLVDPFLPVIWDIMDGDRHFEEEGYFTDFFDRLLLPRFSEIAPMMKHPAFFEECEWRVIVENPTSDLIKERKRKSQVIPYVEIQLEMYTETNSDGICWFPELSVGPSTHNFANELDEIERHLRSAGLESVAIRKTGIPYQSQ